MTNKKNIEEKANEFLDKKISEAVAGKIMEIRRLEIKIKDLKKEVEKIINGEALPSDSIQPISNNPFRNVKPYTGTISSSTYSGMFSR